MTIATPVAIYMLTNTVNNMVYIGQSINPEYRMRRHFWSNNGCIKLKHAEANKQRVWTEESRMKLSVSKTKQA